MTRVELDKIIDHLEGMMDYSKDMVTDWNDDEEPWVKDVYVLRELIDFLRDEVNV